MDNHSFLRCKNLGTLLICGERQSSCIEVNANVFKRNFRQRFFFVENVFRIVAQNAFVGRRDCADGIAGKLGAQLRNRLTHEVVRLVMQTIALPKTLFSFLVGANDIHQEIAGLSKRVLSGLEFFVRFGIHFQDDTGRPHVRSTVHKLTGVL